MRLPSALVLLVALLVSQPLLTSSDAQEGPAAPRGAVAPTSTDADLPSSRGRR